MQPNPITSTNHSGEQLLRLAHSQRASDLHLSSGMPAVLRIDGDMIQSDMPPLSASEVKEIVYALMTETQVSDFEQTLEADFAYDIPNLARFRVNVFCHNRGMGAVFRTIPSTLLSMQALGMGDIFKQICQFKRGLVLVTGPTGCGKSTTLATMIDHINHTRKEHILTIEDPIEFIHESQQSLVNQRELFRHTLSFESALRAALREDPDVILVGELRDLETIRFALSAAETGHLVFATLHTSSAIKTIDRIVDVFPAAEKEMIRAMLSESLQAVISQVLIKKHNATGRIAAHEIMLGTPAIRHLIRENKLAQMYSLIQTGAHAGMLTLDQALQELVNQNCIDKIEAQKAAKQPTAFA